MPRAEGGRGNGNRGCRVAVCPGKCLLDSFGLTDPSSSAFSTGGRRAQRGGRCAALSPTVGPSDPSSPWGSGAPLADPTGRGASRRGRRGRACSTPGDTRRKLSRGSTSTPASRRRARTTRSAADPSTRPVARPAGHGSTPTRKLTRAPATGRKRLRQRRTSHG